MAAFHEKKAAVRAVWTRPASGVLAGNSATGQVTRPGASSFRSWYIVDYAAEDGEKADEVAEELSEKGACERVIHLGSW